MWGFAICSQVWNVGGNWSLEKTLAQHQRWVWDAAFSADSSYLVTASSDHSAKLWELRYAKLLPALSAISRGACV